MNTTRFSLERELFVDMWYFGVDGFYIDERVVGLLLFARCGAPLAGGPG